MGSRILLTLGARTLSGSRHMSSVVRLNYQDLVDKKDLRAEIAAAYGDEGLGLLTVTGIPGFQEARKSLLLKAQPLAQLPEEEKAAMEHPESTYNFGWSHGKEKFEGVPDLLKGSFYANPTMNVPTTDPELIKAHPANCHANIWPREAAMPGFEASFMGLGGLIVDVGLLVAAQCDQYVHFKCGTGYDSDRIRNIIASSRAHKARLLHYFPAEPNADAADWCGWHSDHGSLTGLTSALYTKDCEEVGNPDPDCGLYVRDRSGAITKVAIPAGDVAFQLGETSQIHSGGLLKATPHYVKSPNPELMHGIARNTFAVFMQPEWSEPLDVPPSAKRDYIDVKAWSPGMDFSAFMKAKLEEYY